MAMTARDRSEPRIRQVSFFLPNRLGALRHAVRTLADEGVRIAGMSMLEATDHAVVRLVVDRPDGAHDLLTAAGYSGCLTEILGVTLPPGPRFGIQRALAVLVGAEVSLMYVYGLIVQADGNPVLALRADDLDLAGRVLRTNGFALVGQDDLVWPAAEAS
jgi:hypothetical protein